MSLDITIINTGVANIASVIAAFNRLGAASTLTSDKGAIENAQALVLPGVGSFEAGMRALKERELVEPLRTRILEGRPTLAICLGLQLLFEESEESPGVSGLGIIKETITRFKADVRVPHFGWNQVGDGYAYFANSYKASTVPSDWETTWSEYGERFAAMTRKQRVLACQFHPELSGEFGERLLSSWLKEASC